ncbi:fatty acid desaturase, type 1 [Nitzschia inconspicua]|uniref:Fatty acid desaturase, type 1 n=1 Tax=Nitzschia inconspicua TaxID=303405 RepID=A0A9K3LR30_9STRA|nr:fatty acid desaturase, type 1 [Nitzschia inconspicua]
MRKSRPQLSDVVMAKSEAMLQQRSGSSSVASESSDSSATSVSSSSSKSSSVSSSLWWIHNKGYDLEEFVQRHPGGVEAILLGKGRDCTALVESYHPFTNQHWKVLEKYLVEQPEEDNINEQIPTNDRNDPQQRKDFFYEVLKKRVSTVLISKGIDPKDDRGATITRTLYYCVVFASWLYTGYLHLSGRILGSFLFAITGWLMGALGHDAGHFSASRIPWINEWGVWGMSFICNPILWQHQHTYGHHSFTNEFGHDPDLHHFDTFLRVHKRIQRQSHYRYQSNGLYVMFAYLFVVFGTCFYIPWGVLRTNSLYGIIEWSDKDRRTKSTGMRLHLFLYIFIVAVVPMYTHPSLLSAIFASYLHVGTLGLVFALFSQINHLNELSLESDMISRNEKENSKQHSTSRRDPRLTQSWAAAQVETSNNFASQSLFWHVLSNGLNHQIEHHLFPGLNHCHLHHIAPVVKATCLEFGVQYKSYDTWKDLMCATLEWFDKLS